MTRRGWRVSGAATGFALLVVVLTGLAEPAWSQATTPAPLWEGDEAAASGEVWTVTVEVASGQSISGPVDMRPVSIDCEFGRYAIRPDRIKEIRFTGSAAGAGVEGILALEGSILTTTGQEVAGTIQAPATGWVMSTELGTLTLAPEKLRRLVLESGPPAPAPTAAAVEATATEVEAGATASALAAATATATPTAAARPRTLGPLTWAVFRDGSKVVVRNNETAKAGVLAMPASEQAPLVITPVVSAELLAVEVEGATIGRIAALDIPTAQWYPQDLKEPATGPLEPLVSPGLAVYAAGRWVYAFSAGAKKWGVLQLPEGAQASPVVSGEASLTVEHGGQTHTFDVKTAEWSASASASQVATQPGGATGAATR